MDWHKLMTEIDDRIEALRTVVSDHDKRDDERFAGLKQGIADIKADMNLILLALVGDNKDPGIRERLRTLEGIERDRKWMLRAVWAALIGQGLIIVLKFLGDKT